MRFAVLGLGAAGSACVARLLELAGSTDEIMAFERLDRPAPSPALWLEYAAGAAGEDALVESAPWSRWVQGAGCPAPARLTLFWGNEIVRLDAPSRRLFLQDGQSVGFDRLLVAVGGAPAVRGLSGFDAGHVPEPGIHVLSGTAAVRTLRRDLCGCAPGTAVAIVGAGPTGIRLADLLRERGFEVTLLEAQPLLLPALQSQAASEVLCTAARNAGIRVLTRTEARGAIRSTTGKLEGLSCRRGDGDRFVQCKLAIFCTGTIPAAISGATSPGGNPRNRGAAPPAAGRCRAVTGLPVDSDMAVPGLEGVFAAGDCAVPEGWTAPPGLWPVAAWQGRQAALAMAGLKTAPPPSAVVLTVRFRGLLVRGSRPYSVSAEPVLRACRWEVDVRDASAVRSASTPPEVSEVAD